MRRSTTTGVVTTLLLSVLTTPGTALAEPAGNPLDPYLGQQLSWGECLFTQSPDARPAQCALVRVPRDWADPASGTDLQVSISRVPATGERTGVLLTNPGGPGGQGTSLAGALAALQPALNEQYDIIGMDPRGTGQEGGTTPQQLGLICSVPTSELTTRTDLDARDRSADSIAEHQKNPRAIAEACQSDALTPFITTWQTAHDMDLVRHLLGQEKLHYLGYSYGSWLGAKYASLFPENTGKVVLDSSVNWQGRLQAAFEDFPRIGQRQFEDVFLPWAVRQYPDLLGPTAERAAELWEQSRVYFRDNGVAPDTWDSLFVGMGSEFRFLLAGGFFAAAVREMNGVPEAAAASPEVRERTDAVSREVFGVPVADLTAARVGTALAEDHTKVAGTRLAVACGDQRTRPAAWYRALSETQGRRYPLFGWLYGLSEPCGFWSDAPRQHLPNLPAEIAGQVLVVQGEFDPQTGYESARSAVRAAPGVSLVAVDDAAFHGQYALEGNPCVDGAVNVFLLRNSRPGDITCPGTPLLGEDVVHPVDGPVRGQQTMSTAEVQPSSPLREAVRNRIVEANAR
ncbi:alpha/beta hydrolase [Umezawaea beigongshangensis]|uniref:alpha/beta hydrolase n=1 Tax=Umezawaea beigongshangensis TaxID=2780383 RepID=UPI0018F19198|nr:alpha/beta hydrolase [Umezawaea beigongshangensis]